MEKTSKQRLGLDFLSKYGIFSVNVVARQRVLRDDETLVRKLSVKKFVGKSFMLVKFPHNC